MRMVVGVVSAVAALAVTIAVRAGHEMPVYPSYYPQEIRIEPTTPAAAADALAKSDIQAYVGDIAPPGAEAKDVRAVETLGGFVVVRINPASPLAKDKTARCALAARVITGLGDNADFRRHPYPVTPFHADYFHHADLAEAANARFQTPATDAGRPKVRADGAFAERLVKAPTVAAAWDAAVEEVRLDRLLAPQRLNLDGWSGPPWLKDGWFQAGLLLADGLAGADKARAATLVKRLQRDEHASPEERINLERELVTLLTADCKRVVAGYAIRRQYYNAEYSKGVENIAFDSQEGFNSAIFIRTVKLKDFPWNGWLALGVDGEPKAAWNPIAGFTDDAGRLIWHALGDPAFFPEPYADGWNMNRIGDFKRTPK